MPIVHRSSGLLALHEANFLVWINTKGVNSVVRTADICGISCVMAVRRAVPSMVFSPSALGELVCFLGSQSLAFMIKLQSFQKCKITMGVQPLIGMSVLYTTVPTITHHELSL
jgi:hypothetical protein